MSGKSTNKTDAVMRLLTGKKTSVKKNPILDSGFKEENITSRTPPKNDGTEIDIAGELVSEFLPQVLERFNCCKCPVCYAEAMSDALAKAPTLKIRINNKDDLRQAEAIKAKSRREILTILIRLAIKRRRLKKHEKA